MKKTNAGTFKVFTTAFVLTFAFFSHVLNVDAAKLAGDKIETEELIQKHLESIGTEKARAEVTSILAVGKSKVVFRGRNAGETTGIVVAASEGKKNLVGMKFNNNDYPYEKWGFDGNQFTVGFIQPGVRSNFGEFMLFNEKAFNVGIMGGAIMTSWELLSYDPKVGKLKCGGTEEIDGAKLYECKYDPRKGSDLRMKLLFDQKTFRHVRTEYTRVISGGQGTNINSSSRQNEKRYKMVETFSNFNEFNGLTLPQDYKIYLEILAGNGTSAMEWNMEFTNYQFNQPIDVKEFKVDTY